jgi:hypothetical protein
MAAIAALAVLILFSTCQSLPPFSCTVVQVTLTSKVTGVKGGSASDMLSVSKPTMSVVFEKVYDL